MLLLLLSRLQEKILVWRRFKRDCVNSHYAVPFFLKINAMHEKIFLWFECKKYCLPINRIKYVRRGICQEMCLDGCSPEHIELATNMFLIDVATKLN